MRRSSKENKVKKTRFITFFILIICVSMMSGCFPKAYDSKEEKAQKKRAIAIAEHFLKEKAPSAKLEKDYFHVIDTGIDKLFSQKFYVV